MVPIRSRETKNTIETRLASFASLICEFYLPVLKFKDEVAALVIRCAAVDHQGPRAAVSTKSIQLIYLRSCRVGCLYHANFWQVNKKTEED